MDKKSAEKWFDNHVEMFKLTLEPDEDKQKITIGNLLTNGFEKGWVDLLNTNLKVFFDFSHPNYFNWVITYYPLDVEGKQISFENSKKYQEFYPSTLYTIGDIFTYLNEIDALIESE